MLEYRSGAENDLDNVLQIPTIYLSVGKAQTAPKAELTKAFGPNTSKDAIIEEILRKGVVQVGEKEREEILARVEKEVLDMVSSRLVDPQTKRPYTTGIISKALSQLSSEHGKLQKEKHQAAATATAATEQEGEGKEEGRAKGKGKGKSKGKKKEKESLKEEEPPRENEPSSSSSTATAAEATARKPVWTGFVQKKSAKIQALDAIKALVAWQPIPVMRARMKLRVSCPTPVLKQTPKSASATVKDQILGSMEDIERQETVGDEWEIVGYAEPGALKALGELVSTQSKGKGRVEVLEMAVTES